jgi:hypothetical protein
MSRVEILALVLGALLTVLCVLFVARPLLRSGKDEAPRVPGPAEDARVRLFERRDRALAALKELEFDHRTGKVSDEDYRLLVGPLRAEAAETLKALGHEERPQREGAKADVRR